MSTRLHVCSPIGGRACRGRSSFVKPGPPVNYFGTGLILPFEIISLHEPDLSDAGKQWARQAVKDWRLAKKAAREAAAALPAVADRAATAVEQAAAGRAVDPEALAKVLLAATGATAAAYGSTRSGDGRKERAGASDPARERGERGAPPRA